MKYAQHMQFRTHTIYFTTLVFPSCIGMPKHDANITYKTCRASNSCHLYIGQDKDFTTHFGEEHRGELRTYNGSFI